MALLVWPNEHSSKTKVGVLIFNEYILTLKIQNKLKLNTMLKFVLFFSGNI
jgi:hypothetical protein